LVEVVAREMEQLAALVLMVALVALVEALPLGILALEVAAAQARQGKVIKVEILLALRVAAGTVLAVAAAQVVLALTG
jgi:hypothetical protein